MDWCRRIWARVVRQPRLAQAGVVIAVVAVLVRLLYWAQYVALPLGRVAVGADTLEYDTWARQILAGQWLWTELPIHAPLYPYSLAWLYSLTAVSIPAVRAVQLGLDLLSLTLVALALWRLMNARTAWLCAGLWALYQPLIYYSAELLCEGLVVLLLSAVLLCWAAAHRPGGRGPLRPWPLALSALFCGLAAITHPLTLALTVPYLICCACCRRVVQAPRPRRAWIALLAGLFALPILPVTLRNAVVSGEWVPIQAQEGLNLYIGNNPEATGTCYVRPGAAYDELATRPARAGLNTPSGARRYFQAEVLHFAVRQPLQAARLVVRKALLTWNAADLPSGPDLPLLQMLTPLQRLPLLRFGFVAPLALAAWAVGYRRRRLLPFLWAPLLGTAALALLVTSGRYRLMLTPALLGSAALALEGLWRALQRQDQRTWARAVVLSLAGLALAYAVPVPALPTAETEALTLLAEAAWRTGDARQAEHYARLGLAAAPAPAALYHLLGNALLEQGRTAAAIAAMQSALALEPGRTTATVDLAIAVAAAGDQGTALALLQSVAAAPDAAANARYNQGVIYERQGRLAEARSAYEQALSQDPLHPSSRLNLALLLMRAGDPDPAAAHLAKVLRQRPRDDKALAGLAVYHARRGEYPQASALFARAIAANPQRDDLRQAYATLQAEAASAGPRPAGEEPR
jgi:tetratricopeptide (TPR) repeat protein